MELDSTHDIAHYFKTHHYLVIADTRPSRLYNNEYSVFGSNPFPNGKIPSANPGITALVYARTFINTASQTLVSNSAVGDPASLGVSSILLGQTNSIYIGAASRQADYILNQAPKWSNGAISHRPDVAEIWADFTSMAPPFCMFSPRFPVCLHSKVNNSLTWGSEIYSGILGGSTK